MKPESSVRGRTTGAGSTGGTTAGPLVGNVGAVGVEAWGAGVEGSGAGVEGEGATVPVGGGGVPHPGG